MKNFSLRSTVVLCALSLVLTFTASALAQKMTVEELVSKHRDAIGSKDKLASMTGLMAMGVSEFESKFPSKKVNGKGVVASRGNDYMFIISLGSSEYPFEKIGYF